MSGLLLDTPLDDEQRDYAETIHTSGEALLTIINDILDFSKIEAGRFELDAHPFALAATVEGALDVMGPVAATKGLELATRSTRAYRRVVGDAGRLRQIMLNLLSNAIKFTETRRGRPSGRRRASWPTTDGGGRRRRWEIRLAVSDTGMGIPPDRIGRLFQSFSQADASISRRFGGTGLGLAISRRLAELMDGSLDAESSGVPGEGSAFTLSSGSRTPRRSRAARLRSPPPTWRDGACSSSTTTPRTSGSSSPSSSIAAAVPSALVRGRPGLAASRRRSTSSLPTSECRRRRPGAGGAPGRAGRRAPPVVVLSSAGHRDRVADGVAAFVSKPVKPAALRDALIGALGGRVEPRRRPRGPGAPASTRLGARHPLGSCSPRTTPSTRSLRSGCSSEWATRPTSRTTASRRSPPSSGRVRRRAHGRPDARARRPRGDTPDPRRVAATGRSGSSR